MSSQAIAILKSFESLPDLEKYSVASEILQRMPDGDNSPESMLDGLADELFSALDEEEAHAEG